MTDEMKAKCEELATCTSPDEQSKYHYIEGFTAAVELMEASTVPVEVVEKLVVPIKYMAMERNPNVYIGIEKCTKALADYEAWKQQTVVED